MDKSKATWKGKGIVESSSQGRSQSSRVNQHLIPGPAGIVQATWQRRTRGEGVQDMNTQQAVHRALTVEADDTDFDENPAWLNAIQFGYLEIPGYTDLATVSRLPSGARVDLVVALVKSVERTQSGTPWLVLKDPTSTVSASIHHKAHAEGKYEGKIKKGVCLVLTDTAIWRPYTTSYLNITSMNVQHVIE